ncbi:MAG: hypothetical protein Q9161_007003 [Pseudevernia consocians]
MNSVSGVHGIRGVPNSKLRFGVENEFFLEAHSRQAGQVPDARAFAETLVEFYNANIATGLAPLRLDFSHSSHPGHFPTSTESWAVTHDMPVHNLPGDLVQIKAYSLGMVSPILDFCAGSIWRTQISDH